MQERITLRNRTQYHIGAVTYDVTACFNENREPLKDIVRKLLLNDIHKSQPRKFASYAEKEV